MRVARTAARSASSSPIDDGGGLLDDGHRAAGVGEGDELAAEAAASASAERPGRRPRRRPPWTRRPSEYGPGIDLRDDAIGQRRRRPPRAHAGGPSAPVSSAASARSSAAPGSGQRTCPSVTRSSPASDLGPNDAGDSASVAVASVLDRRRSRPWSPPRATTSVRPVRRDPRPAAVEHREHARPRPRRRSSTGRTNPAASSSRPAPRIATAAARAEHRHRRPRRRTRADPERAQRRHPRRREQDPHEQAGHEAADVGHVVDIGQDEAEEQVDHDAARRAGP